MSHNLILKNIWNFVWTNNLKINLNKFWKLKIWKYLKKYPTGGCHKRGQNWPQKIDHVCGIYLISTTFVAPSLKINTSEKSTTFVASSLKTKISTTFLAFNTANILNQDNSEKPNFEIFIEFCWRSELFRSFFKKLHFGVWTFGVKLS